MACKIEEISGDLFTSAKDFCLAHCVAADLKMGKGIAVKFRDKFGQVEALRRQNVEAGGVAILRDSNRFIYYLVTKKTTYQKPTYQSMFSSLNAMRDHMRENGMKKLAVPKIGCGLDGLDWDKVKDQLGEIFQNDEVYIVVYHYNPNK